MDEPLFKELEANLQLAAETYGMKPFPGESKRMFQTRVENLIDIRKKALDLNSWRTQFPKKS